VRIGSVRKGEDDILDYDLSYVEWLTDGDTIIEAEAVVEAPNGGAVPLAIDSVSAFSDDKKVKVWLSGGTYGTPYTVETTITTSLGRVKTTCFQVRIMTC